MLVKEAVDDFLIACAADGLKPSTVEWYRNLLRKFVDRAGQCELTDISVRDMRLHIVYLSNQNYSPDTIHCHNRALRRFWAWCALEYDINNPMKNIKPMRQPKPNSSKAIALDDVVKLVETCDSSVLGKRDRAIIIFLMDTGCRVAGLCNLGVEDVDIDAGVAYLTEKGDKRRIVAFTDVTAQLLRDWQLVRSKDSTAFFHGYRGEYLKPNGLRQMLTRRKRLAGIKGRVNPHSFRHRFAREYLLDGGDLATLSKILGHSGQDVTTQFYAIFATEELVKSQRLHSPVQKIKRVLNLGSKSEE